MVVPPLFELFFSKKTILQQRGRRLLRSHTPDITITPLVGNSNGVETVLATAITTFSTGPTDYYTMKASVDGDTLSAKFWLTSDTEPVAWDITATDTSYTQGKIGLAVTTNTTRFDNVSVNPL